MLSFYFITDSASDQPTNPMEHSFPKANGFSANQEISRILRKQKFHYLTHNNPPLVPILRQINPVRCPVLFFFEDQVWAYAPIYA
jgi:hypothetical protein